MTQSPTPVDVEVLRVLPEEMLRAAAIKWIDANFGILSGKANATERFIACFVGGGQMSWESATKALLDELTTLRQQAGNGVPEGWRLVPETMTPEMYRSAWKLIPTGQGINARSIYDAMLTTSPQPPGNAPEKALREALGVAKRAILKAAKDTLWCDDTPAETVVDRIDALLAEADGQDVLPLSDAPEQAVAGEALREALERMVYETTHLSPCKPNGDHDCTIKADALAQARAALATPAGSQKTLAADTALVPTALVEALRKVMPIRVNDGPDYAEAYFADGASHSTQAMTMNPQDWRDLDAAWRTYTPKTPDAPEALS